MFVTAFRPAASILLAAAIAGASVPDARFISAAVTVTPNGPWVEGLNSVVVQGGGRGEEIATAAALDSGREVRVLWYFTGQRWTYHLPALRIDTIEVPALASVYVVLGASAISVTPNAGQYTAGANAVVVTGAGSAAAVASQIEVGSGRQVISLWVFSGQRWFYFLRANPGVEGGLAFFTGPVAAAVVILA